jgi:hypothetical protein
MNIMMETDSEQGSLKNWFTSPGTAEDTIMSKRATTTTSIASAHADDWSFPRRNSSKQHTLIRRRLKSLPGSTTELTCKVDLKTMRLDIFPLNTPRSMPMDSKGNIIQSISPLDPRCDYMELKYGVLETAKSIDNHPRRQKALEISPKLAPIWEEAED